MGATSILIVDDEKNMRTTLADILAEEGYEVSVAESGDRAVKMFEKSPFDFVLMDVRMPGMDGVEAFHLIRRRRADAQVIMMSAYGMDHLRRQVLDEGAIGFMRKPLDVEGLIKLIRGGKQMTILAVEAGPCVSEIAEGLRREGYRVSVARSAEEALELVPQIHFDVVFVDEALSIAGGVDVASIIRGATPSSKAVLVTGRDPSGMAGMDAALRKPPRLDDALSLLTRMRTARTPDAA